MFVAPMHDKVEEKCLSKQGKVFRHRPNNYQLARDTFVVAALACQAGTAFLFLPASKFAFFAMPMRARRISGTAKKRTRQTNFSRTAHAAIYNYFCTCTEAVNTTNANGPRNIAKPVRYTNGHGGLCFCNRLVSKTVKFVPGTMFKKCVDTQ